MRERKATFIGFGAILFFSTLAGLIRGVSEGLGAVGGAAMIYSLAFLMLLFTIGFPDIRKFPRAYLCLSCVLFVSYEVCLSLSLGFANSRSQSIEVSMVNYLWPSMTILLSILFRVQRASLVLIPGLLLSFTGLCYVLGGSNGLSITMIFCNIQTNPLSYGLAFGGAIVWSAYCVLTSQKAKGQNGITLYFLLTATTLWIKYAAGETMPFHFSLHVAASLVFSAFALGCGYAAWNIGILYGNVTVLSTASYFIPILSSALGAAILSTTLGAHFWFGAMMISLGSMLSWRSTSRSKEL